MPPAIKVRANTEISNVVSDDPVAGNVFVAVTKYCFEVNNAALVPPSPLD